MDALLDGYRRFRKANWPEQERLFLRLAVRGQTPRAMVLACIDSRVDPAMIFDAGPGELLVVRNVANLAPPYAPDTHYHGTSAALEFGVRVMEVHDLIVLGHGSCGGVQALLNGAPETARDFVAPWMAMGDAARDRALKQPPDVQQVACEHEVIKVSLSNLMTFPWIASRVELGTLKLHGLWFNIQTGELEYLTPAGGFAAVVE